MRSFSPCPLTQPRLSIRSPRSGASLSLMILTAIVVMLSARFGHAQSKEPVVEEKTLVTEDRFELKVTYFKSMGGKDAAVIVLLHGKAGQRRQWTAIAQNLQKQDFAVVTVDLRGHGESPLPKKADIKKTDYQAMAAMDMVAVKDFLFEEHQKGQLNINKLGIVACDFSASIALVVAELDWLQEPYDDNPVPEQRTPRGQDIQALVLISPDTTTPGLFAAKTTTMLRGSPIAFMIATSEKNTHDFTAAKKLLEQVSSKKEKEKDEKISFKKYPDNVRGMDLVLQNKQLKLDLYDFLNKHVKNHQSTWRDRRSRLERE